MLPIGLASGPVFELLKGVIGPMVAKMGNEEAAKRVSRKFEKTAPWVVEDLTADGVTYDHKTAARPNPPDAFVAAIMYRYLQNNMKGGFPKDKIRDYYFPKVRDLVVSRGLARETPADQAVKMVADAWREVLL